MIGAQQVVSESPRERLPTLRAPAIAVPASTVKQSRHQGFCLDDEAYRSTAPPAPVSPAAVLDHFCDTYYREGGQ
jgi:hypothetical protein